MTEEDARALIARMSALYQPPTHLRGNAQAKAEALVAYERVLSPFDGPTLERAWLQVVANNAFWIWPQPGALVAACRTAQAVSIPRDETPQREKALEMAAAYTDHFMKTSRVAKLARREGWGDRLQGYVAAAAWVQAQILNGVRCIGWDSCLTPEHPRFRSSQEAFASYRQTIADALESGEIQVTVPKERIRQWKDALHSRHQENPPAEDLGDLAPPARRSGRGGK
jgi:hypothetical protein